MTRKKRSWWWRCLCIAFALWLAFTIVRVLKQPFVLIAVGLAVEALHS